MGEEITREIRKIRTNTNFKRKSFKKMRKKALMR